VVVSSANDSVAGFSLASGTRYGEYYFDVYVASSLGDTVKASTFVTLDSSGVRAFDIRTDHARWIDSAVVYGVTPRIFVDNGRLVNITQKIPELAGLGVTTLWIQPIFKTHGGGQGYDIIDHFSVRSDVGNAADLRTLIQTAHANHIRVLLDFVPNHTSSFHPYAQDGIVNGQRSYYYDFYQHSTLDGARYSGDYSTRTEGQMQFVYYRFWGSDLVNLNYNNPDVQRWIIEASKYWIENFDIDGYRIDAVWGVTARTPEFTKAWRLALKRVKPEILLLAEDKAKYAPVFDERFDAAYDWAPEEGWVSHWNWQPAYSANSNPTIFNTSDPNVRAGLLRTALTGFPPSAKVLHFMENNDTFRFLATHDLPRTTMVGAMLLSLPGTPLLFNGQEIGASQHPYSASMIFQANRSIQSQDQYGLFTFYKNVIAMRRNFPALMSNNFTEVPVAPHSAVYAYRRWLGNQNVFSVLNMGPSATTVQMSLPVADLNLDSTRTYYLTDYLTGQTFTGTKQSLASVSIPVNGYATRVLILDTLAVTGVDPGSAANLPLQLSLGQNYPNPFNPATSIRFGLPARGSASLKVFDVLGREVAVLLDGEAVAGAHEVMFEGKNLASGVYIYRLVFQGESVVKKMLMVK
jgi:glycosidase